MKSIVIGTSLSGKTTLVKYLRAHTNIVVREIDEEIKERSAGKWPVDNNYRSKILGQEIIRDILKRDNIIFFTNTNYFSERNLLEAHQNGFKIIQLFIGLDELQRRNKNRMNHEGYDDLSKWLQGMFSYQEKVRNQGLVDIVIDAKKPVETIAKEIIESQSD